MRQQKDDADVWLVRKGEKLATRYFSHTLTNHTAHLRTLFVGFWCRKGIYYSLICFQIAGPLLRCAILLTNYKHWLQRGPFAFLFCFLAFFGVIIWVRIQQGVVRLYAAASYTMDLYICIGRSVKRAPSLSLTMLSGAEMCVHHTIYMCNHFGEIDLPK